MPSPFPGMDPYLEQHWGDVHTSLVTYARNQLQTLLPKDLRARVEERVVGSEPETQRSVEIRQISSRSGVITAVEVLRPSNKKPGDLQEEYLRKQRKLLQQGVNLVEIDLLREGDWIVALPLYTLGRDLRTPYRSVVRYTHRPMQAAYYPIRLQERLPKIRVPLRPDDADVRLHLQPLIEQCYENGGYDDIDYSREPKPPLTGALARWAAQLLRQRKDT